MKKHIIISGIVGTVEVLRLCLDGGMDGWVGGWVVDGWMGGWVDG